MESSNQSEIKRRVICCVREVLPSSKKTCIWMIKITAGVSFAMMLLKFFNILPLISDFLSPAFEFLGLPGSAALAYLSGYFINNYSAIAVAASLELDWRAATIIATMCLCSHSMVLETAVLKKTGASATRMVIVRTLSAFLLGWLLNLILPQTSAVLTDAAATQWTTPFWPTFLEWLLSTLKLALTMTLIIFGLNILQRLLQEFGVMEKIAHSLKPLMTVLGLPDKTAFLWIVANVVGLGYGAAAMLDEISRGSISRDDVRLLDSHICVNHSNLEDLMLMTVELGGIWWIMLLVRTLMATLLVWEQRLEFALSKKYFWRLRK